MHGLDIYWVLRVYDFFKIYGKTVIWLKYYQNFKLLIAK